MKVVVKPTVRENIPLATLLGAFGTELQFNQPMAELTSFKTGGSARYFLDALDIESIIRAIKSAQRLEIDYFIMGSGSNLLVSDLGYDGLVIRLDINDLTSVTSSVIEAGAGAKLMDLVNFTTEKSMTGLEFAAGIWGSVGGAIAGNAGAYGGDMGSIIQSVKVVNPDGELKTITREDCGFRYRDSNLKGSGNMIVSARFSLDIADHEAIKGKVEEILLSRTGKHPEKGLSAGCFFKNIVDHNQPHGKLPAGRLLEEAGVKSLRVGGAKVFEKHANIIVNDGNATSKDIRTLADIMKKKVFELSGIMLEEEVQQLGHFEKENAPIDS